MEDKLIPFTGIDNQSDGVFNSNEGSFASLENIRPTGNPNNIKWEPVHALENILFFLEYDDGTVDVVNVEGVASCYCYGGRWFVVIVHYDDTGTYTDHPWRSQLYSCNYTGGRWVLNNKLFDIPNVAGNTSSSILAQIKFIWKEINDELYLLSNKQMWKVSTAEAKPWVVPPFISSIQCTVNTPSSITLTRFNNYFADGSYPGFLRNKDKYIGIIYALKFPNGEYIKHTQPLIKKLSLLALDDTNVGYSTLTFSNNSDYTDNETNYEDNAELFATYQFPIDISSSSITDEFDFVTHGESAGGQWLETGIFITTPKDSFQAALNEGTYYLIGSKGFSGTGSWSVDFNDNEETIAANPTLNIDPLSHHVTTPVYLGEYRNNTVCVGTRTNFVLPGWEWVNELGRYLYGETTPDPPYLREGCAVKVRIKVGDSYYYRWNYISMLYLGTTVYIPDFLSYPDQRADRIWFYWYDTGNSQYYELGEYQLFAHPFLNIAYNYYDSDGGTIRTLTSSTGNETLDFSDNETNLIEYNKIRVSDLTQLFFPLERTYLFDNDIVGVIDNTDMGQEGQLGDYPIYALGKDKIYGGRGSDNAFIARWDVIASDVGANGPFAYTVFKNSLWFLSSKGIHLLSGGRVENIHYPISTLASSGNVLYREGTLFGCVAANVETEEVLFTNMESIDAIYVFNYRYKRWWTFDGGIYPKPECNIFTIKDKTYLFDHNSAYNQDGISAISTFLYEWGSWNDVGNFKRYSGGYIGGYTQELDSELQNFTASFETNPIVLNDYSVMKRIRRAILQGYFDLSLDLDTPSLNRTMTVTLKGIRSTHDDPETLMTVTDNTSKTITSRYLKTNYGAFQAFVLEFTAKGLKTGSYIKSLLMQFQNRNKHPIG